MSYIDAKSRLAGHGNDVTGYRIFGMAGCWMNFNLLTLQHQAVALGQGLRVQMRGTGVIDQRLMTAHMIWMGVGLGDMLEPQIMDCKKLENRIDGAPVYGNSGFLAVDQIAQIIAGVAKLSDL